jgi:hypothetical protein
MSDITARPGAAGAPGRIILVIGEHQLCDTPLDLRSSSGVPVEFGERWAENTLAQIDAKFIPGWETVLSDLDSFTTLLVEPATSGYPDFLSEGRISRRGHSTELSLRLHAVKLAASYDKLVAAIDYLTTTGRDAFEAKLHASEETYRNAAALPLSLTGDYADQLLGAAVRQWFFLNADPRLLQYRWLGDVIEQKFPPDDPYLWPGPKWQAARRHNNLLIQGGCFVLQGLSIQKVHDDLDTFLYFFLRDTFLPPPDSFIRFELVEGILTIRTLLAFA